MRSKHAIHRTKTQLFIERVRDDDVLLRHSVLVDWQSIAACLVMTGYSSLVVVVLVVGGKDRGNWSSVRCGWVIVPPQISLYRPIGILPNLCTISDLIHLNPGLNSMRFLNDRISLRFLLDNFNGYSRRRFDCMRRLSCACTPHHRQTSKPRSVCGSLCFVYDRVLIQRCAELNKTKHENEPVVVPDRAVRIHIGIQHINTNIIW